MPELINIPNNSEIDAALKEFEAKNAEQKQQVLEALKASPVPVIQKEVSGVSFETDNQRTDKFNQEIGVPKMVQLMMKYFGLKEQKQAEYFLFGFVILAIGISLFLVLGGGKKNTSPSQEIMNNALNQTIQNIQNHNK
jgi:hypothetical protein